MKIFNSYFPRTDGKLVLWAETYKEKLPQIGPGLGLTKAEIAEICEAVQSLINSIHAVSLKKATLKEAAETKRILKKKVLHQVRNVSGRMKTSQDYTVNMGMELGIVATGQPVDMNELKPVLKLKSQQKHVRINFIKQRMVGIRHAHTSGITTIGSA